MAHPHTTTQLLVSPNDWEWLKSDSLNRVSKSLHKGILGVDKHAGTCNSHSGDMIHTGDLTLDSEKNISGMNEPQIRMET